MTRAEFSQKTKLSAWKRTGGICECGCGQPFGKHPKERPEYHHRVEAAIGGDNSLENCQCIRADCHSAITSKVSAPRVAKARRGEKERMGLKRKPIRPLPGSKGSKWKQKIGGKWEKRD